MLDPDVMRQIAEGYFVAVVARQYGEPGVAALKEILEFLPRLYAYVDLDQIPDRLFVVRALKASTAFNYPDDTKEIVGLELIAEAVRDGSVVEIVTSNTARVWSMIADSAPEGTLAYRLSKNGESMLVEGSVLPIPNPDPVHRSVFARPSFHSLKDALKDYSRRMARTSTCFLLRRAWETENRLFAKTQEPEKEMRRSLHQFLKSVLRDADVQPELNVDETHPVDITVSWVLTNRRAIIEIKWLGKSRGDGRITVGYSESRARAGAKQLADYLDSLRSSLPDRVLRGYLVVIDARRRGLRADSESISRENGFYYEEREIDFDPEYHRIRSDFEEPIRMFVEPVCAA